MKSPGPSQFLSLAWSAIIIMDFLAIIYGQLLLSAELLMFPWVLSPLYFPFCLKGRSKAWRAVNHAVGLHHSSGNFALAQQPQLSSTSPNHWHVLLPIPSAAMTCLQCPLALPVGKMGEISFAMLPDPYSIAWSQGFESNFLPWWRDPERQDGGTWQKACAGGWVCYPVQATPICF